MVDVHEPQAAVKAVEGAKAEARTGRSRSSCFISFGPYLYIGKSSSNLSSSSSNF